MGLRKINWREREIVLEASDDTVENVWWGLKEVEASQTGIVFDDITPQNMRHPDRGRMVKLAEDWSVTVVNERSGVFRITGELILEEGGKIIDRPPAFLQLLQFIDWKFKVLGDAQQQAADFAHWSTSCSSSGTPLSLLFFDIDHFKKLNSRFTESVVDQDFLPVLQRRVVEVVGRTGAVYLQGGDEMVAIFPGLDQCDAQVKSDELRRAVASLKLVVAGEELSVTISGGVAGWREGERLDELQRRANRAERRAKQSGRNRIEVASEA